MRIQRATQQTDTAKTPAGAQVVGVGSSTPIPANVDRVEVHVWNAHDPKTDNNVIWLALGVGAALDSGVRLGPGDSFSTAAYTGAVSAIATLAGSKLSFVEL